jgi:O-antigen ligase
MTRRWHLWHRDPWRTRRTPHDRDAHDGTLELVAACGIVGLCLLVFWAVA